MAQTETVAFDIRVTGDQQSAAKLDRVSGAFKKLEAGGGDAGKSMQQAGERIARISALASTASPEIGKLVGTLGKAASAASTLSLAVGGPAGLAVGGLVAAFSIWTDYTEKQRAKLEELNKTMRESITVSLTFEERLAAVTKARGQRELQQRLASGAASSDEYTAEIMLLKEQLKREQAGNKGGVSAIERGYQRDIDRYRSALENAKARESIEATLSSGGNKTGAIGENPATGGRKESGISRAGLQLDQLRNQAAAEKEEFTRQQQALADVEKLYAAQAAEMRRVERDEREAARVIELERWKSDREERMRILKEGAENEQRLEAETAEKRKLLQSVAIAGAQNVAGATTNALVKISHGQKMSTAAFLAGIGDQAIADGTFHILQGAAMLATLNPAGAAAIAAGGAEVAFGRLIGGGKGGGGNGGGSGGGSSNVRGSYSAEPTARAANNEAPRESRANINVVVQTLVADERTGERVMQSIEQAHMKLGRKMSSSVVGRS